MLGVNIVTRNVVQHISNWFAGIVYFRSQPKLLINTYFINFAFVSTLILIPSVASGRRGYQTYFVQLRFQFQWSLILLTVICHDDVIEWKHFLRYCLFVRGIHRPPVDSPHKGQWLRALMFSLICAWTNCLANNRDAGDLRWYCAHYSVTVMIGVNCFLLFFARYITCKVNWFFLHAWFACCFTYSIIYTSFRTKHI